MRLIAFDRMRAQKHDLHACMPHCRHSARMPHRHISIQHYMALSLGNRPSHTSQLMHAISHMHNTHFEHMLSYVLLTCVLCADHLARLDSRGSSSFGGPHRQDDRQLLRRGLQLVLVCMGAAPKSKLYCSYPYSRMTLRTLQCNFNGKMYSFQIRKYVSDLHPKL